jgi:hypothetical protein
MALQVDPYCAQRLTRASHRAASVVLAAIADQRRSALVDPACIAARCSPLAVGSWPHLPVNIIAQLCRRGVAVTQLRRRCMGSRVGGVDLVPGAAPARQRPECGPDWQVAVTDLDGFRRHRASLDVENHQDQRMVGDISDLWVGGRGSVGGRGAGLVGWRLGLGLGLGLGAVHTASAVSWGDIEQARTRRRPGLLLRATTSPAASREARPCGTADSRWIGSFVAVSP